MRHTSRLLVPLFCCTALLPAQLITLSPTADATTVSNQPAVNLGTSPNLDFGKVFASPSYFTRGHVQFDLAPFVGIGLIPTRATFHWYQSSAQGAGCLDVALHRLTAPWAETTVTWQTQPSHDPVEVGRVCVGNSFALGWKEFDVTALVRAWLDGSVPNFGFVIRDPLEITAGASRPGIGHSREAANATLRPYLEIDVADVLGAGCTTHATMPALDVAAGSSLMGQTLQLRLRELQTGSLPLLFFGLSNTSWSGTPLPFGLAVLGLPACTLHVEPATSLVLPITAGTTATLPIAVPNVPAFDGLPLFVQGFALTPATQLEATNGLGVRLWL
jgi:hypothetical protein